MPKAPQKKRSRTHGTGPLPTGAKGGKGQHFLRNMTVVRRIVDKAAIKSTDAVLEVGPGTGIFVSMVYTVGWWCGNSGRGQDGPRRHSAVRVRFKLSAAYCMQANRAGSRAG